MTDVNFLPFLTDNSSNYTTNTSPSEGMNAICKMGPRFSKYHPCTMAICWKTCVFFQSDKNYLIPLTLIMVCQVSIRRCTLTLYSRVFLKWPRSRLVHPFSLSFSFQKRLFNFDFFKITTIINYQFLLKIIRFDILSNND